MFWIIVFIIVMCVAFSSDSKTKNSKGDAKPKTHSQKFTEFHPVRRITVKGYDKLRKEFFDSKFDVTPDFYNDKVSFFIDSSLTVNDRFQHQWGSAVFYDASGRVVPINKTRYRMGTWSGPDFTCLEYFA